MDIFDDATLSVLEGKSRIKFIQHSPHYFRGPWRELHVKHGAPPVSTCVKARECTCGALAWGKQQVERC